MRTGATSEDRVPWSRGPWMAAKPARTLQNKEPSRRWSPPYVGGGGWGSVVHPPSALQGEPRGGLRMRRGERTPLPPLMDGLQPRERLYPLKTLLGNRSRNRMRWWDYNGGLDTSFCFLFVCLSFFYYFFPLPLRCLSSRTPKNSVFIFHSSAWCSTLKGGGREKNAVQMNCPENILSERNDLNIVT